ncbi:MAG TPA: SOS response-associated peptidase [Acidimicrobiales bacterium]|nr:SOS response-associated peptidase [Acidimicrobiales bacterium]
MCGRIALYTPPDTLARLFDAELAAGAGDLAPRWNVAPTTDVLGLRFGGGSGTDGRPVGSPDGDGPARLPLVLDRFRWGLVPAGAADPSPGSRLFNARAESVATRSSFRDAFDRHRAVVLADGFYEWRKGPGSRRRPHYFRRADSQPLALAGLWADWRDPRPEAAGRPAVRTCAVITTTASQDMDGVHDRMPVVLARDLVDLWVDPAVADHDELAGLLRPPPAGTLVHHPVDQRVGNVRHDDPALVVPVGADPEPATLF